MKNNILSASRSILSATVLHILKPLKLSFILGSKAAFFSVTQSVAPVFGFFSSPAALTGLFGLRALLTFFVTGLTLHSTLLYHIPTFCGALYLNKGSKAIQLFLPITAILSFIGYYQAQPVCLYALYWMIPVIISLSGAQSIFLRALGSTFTAHAIGTMSFMLMHQPEPAFFMALAPLVFVERVLFASIMTLAYHGINAMTNIFATALHEPVRAN